MPPPIQQTPDSREPSVARMWNEALLASIRKDLARPTVHARNLFHVSAAMYDAWAVYSDTAQTYLAGKTLHGFDCAMDAVDNGRSTCSPRARRRSATRPTASSAIASRRRPAPRRRCRRSTR